jgi:hypothetical protein
LAAVVGGWAHAIEHDAGAVVSRPRIEYVIRREAPAIVRAASIERGKDAVKPSRMFVVNLESNPIADRTLRTRAADTSTTLAILAS